MNTRELNFPKIETQSSHLVYGGNQEWFKKKWQRQSGCASTSGANLAAYYAINFKEMKELFSGDTQNLTQENYLDIMDIMFHYMRPGLIGFPYASKFAKRFSDFCLSKNIKVESNVLKKWGTIREASDFITSSIDRGHPVALLILFHRAKELRNDNWHWVTISGYTYKNEKLEQIILSNGGRRQIVSADVLLEKHPLNIIRMVTFNPKK